MYGISCYRTALAPSKRRPSACRRRCPIDQRNYRPLPHNGAEIARDSLIPSHYLCPIDHANNRENRRDCLYICLPSLVHPARLPLPRLRILAHVLRAPNPIPDHPITLSATPLHHREHATIGAGQLSSTSRSRANPPSYMTSRLSALGADPLQTWAPTPYPRDSRRTLFIGVYIGRWLRIQTTGDSSQNPKKYPE